MSEYRAVTLGGLIAEAGGSIKTGPFGTVLKASEYSQGGVPVISVGEIGHGEIRVHDSTPRASAALVARLPEFVLRTGDIVVARKGAVDRSAWVRPEQTGWFLGSDGIRIRTPDEVDTKYLAYQLRSCPVRRWLTQHAAGTTMASMNASILGQVPLRLPEASERKAIVEVLGALDDKITANTGLVKTCQDLALLLGSRASRTIPLSEIVNVSKTSRSPDDISCDKVWHYSLPAFDHASRPLLDSRDRIKSAKLALSGPCVLISKLNPQFPRVWNLPELHQGESVASPEFLPLQPTVCSTGVLWTILSQRSFRSKLEGKVSGTSGSHQRVRPADLLATEIGDPRSIPPKDQGRITGLCDLVFQLREESAHLVELRDTLLPPLMSGRLRVRDAEKQVGEVV